MAHVMRLKIPKVETEITEHAEKYNILIYNILHF
jgi:hypothetical protein